MSKILPKNVFLEGIWRPWPADSDINDLTIIGEIPPELHGTYYRNGPNPQYVYSENYHMYEGDGMIHAMNFDYGQVSYQNRWVRTEKFLAERQARKSLFGGMRDFMACDDSVKNSSRNTANTHVIWHHNTLLALNEGGQPISIDVNDLTQCKTYTFNNVLDRSMMAHPKIDPVSHELIFYSYFAPEFMYYIADKKGTITHQQKINLPYLSLMHDFAITENFTIFPLFPLTWDFQRIMRKETVFKWEPHLNTRFAIMPRYGKNEDVIWFEEQATLGMHVLNAWEEKDKIILILGVMDDVPQNAVAFGDDGTTYNTYLTKWIFDLKQRKIVKERIDGKNTEFPRMDERFVGRCTKHAYLNATIGPKLSNGLFNSIVHFDLTANQQQVHQFDVGVLPLEPIFVPRYKDGQEGDGFLLSYVYHEASDRSDLVILDAQRVDEEPLAIIQLPHRVPFGFHGSWVSKR